MGYNGNIVFFDGNRMGYHRNTIPSSIHFFWGRKYLLSILMSIKYRASSHLQPHGETPSSRSFGFCMMRHSSRMATPCTVGKNQDEPQSHCHDFRAPLRSLEIYSDNFRYPQWWSIQIPPIMVCLGVSKDVSWSAHQIDALLACQDGQISTPQFLSESCCFHIYGGCRKIGISSKREKW